MTIMQKLKRDQEKRVKTTLRNLRQKAPSVYRDLILKLPPQASAGLGALDWSKIGDNIIDAYVSTSQYKAISAEERKAAELELKKLQEQNRVIDAQIQAEKERSQLSTVASHAQMAGESLLDQLIAQPWALPAVGLLGFALWSSISRRKGRR